ncbi:PLP-dependent transferase [Aspergillus steynii IBT 23096]|uniref:PLP-dependent transferase n=1 Tax=Aspergillus steynii IBT 23096 TaxID=1392250 RepID=A0A2I2FWL6_9EURO|nr:PLP-dependent transferase [Aspergillus steynii IBT 23096]PLB45032.1 PLP-dependent transferase [Aspergillus steynii IBT 23096]
MHRKHQINFFRGSPAHNLVPTELLKHAASAALSDPTISGPGCDYGPDEGYLPLRENIAKWLSSAYQPAHSIDAGRICITGGASQNLACLLQVFTDPVQTRAIWLPQPTYHLVFQVFEDAGFHGLLKAIPEDAEGMDAKALDKAISRAEKDPAILDRLCETPMKPSLPYRKIYKHIIYCVPTFANPTGITMPISRREELIRVSRKHDALIVSDDVYDFLHASAAASQKTTVPPPRIVDIDRNLDGGLRDQFGNALSNGSFSKLIGPGCRVGWAEGPAALVYGLSQCGSNISGGAPSQLMSTFINQLLRDGSLTTHIEKDLIPACTRRFNAISSAIREHLVPLGVSFQPDGEIMPAGGYFVWLTLPAHLDNSKVCRDAESRGNLILGNGPVFAVPGNEVPGVLRRQLRLCYMWVDERDIVEGVLRLKEVIVRNIGNQKEK